MLDSIKELGSRYRAWLVDIWGVMHNGHRAFPGAVAATRTFRAQGGIVVLLSNSPRPSPSVQEQLRRLGVPDDAYDATVTSGDLTRHELAKHHGATVFHLGPERDRPIFHGLDVELGAARGRRARGLLRPVRRRDRGRRKIMPVYCATLAARELPMICANPDHMVERGDRLVWCAGALAQLYEQAGRHRDLCRQALCADLSACARDHRRVWPGETVAKDEVLAIGDGVNTDIAGAAGVGIDAVFVASGLHVPPNSGGEGGAETLDRAHLAELFAHAKRRPLGAMRALIW